MNDDLPRRRIRDVEFAWSRSSAHWVCQECGSLVADYPKHAAWHARSDA